MPEESSSDSIKKEEKIDINQLNLLLPKSNNLNISYKNKEGLLREITDLGFNETGAINQYRMFNLSSDSRDLISYMNKDSNNNYK